MDMGLADKAVLVTGATTGIGRHTARRFAKEGARVLFTYASNRAAAASLVEEIRQGGGEAWGLHMDLRRPDSVATALAEAQQAGPVDVLVNNAVTWEEQLPTEGDAWRERIRANLEGCYQCCATLLPAMAERGWGRIVSLSSNLAEDGIPGSAAYSAAKAGVHGMMRGMMWDAGPRGVLLNIVMPGLTLTERALSDEHTPEHVREWERKRTPTGRLSSPEDVARLVVYLGSNANQNITGEIVRVTGGR